MNVPASLRNPITPWENELWTPEPVFAGKTVFVAASGPSFTQEIATKLPADRTIVVNSSCLLVPDAAVLFFTDSGWYEKHRFIVANWPGLVTSMSRLAKRELPEKVKRVKGCGAPEWPPYRAGLPRVLAFPPIGSPEIHGGRSSGHTAVSLAIAMGATQVALVGFDMRVVGGLEHFHNEYTGPRDLGIYAEFVQCFRGWNEAARNSGVEIVNCTPGSAVTEFPFADLDEVLACARS